jgi:hypothetical protein
MIKMKGPGGFLRFCCQPAFALPPACIFPYVQGQKLPGWIEVCLVFTDLQRTTGHNQCLTAFSVELDMLVNMLFSTENFPVSGTVDFQAPKSKLF